VSRGFSILEALTALTVAAVTLSPILGLTGQNVRSTDALRVRALARQAARNAVEYGARVGAPSANEIQDPWRAAPEMFGDAEREQLERLARVHGLGMSLSVESGGPHGDRVVCTVRWRDPLRPGHHEELKHVDVLQR
jgi:hypothetical protein